MFHPHEITNNSHSTFSKDSEDGDFCNVCVQPSLLTVLDDKNKIIATLRRQLQNQKVQLTYYLKKELSPKKIIKLSESCSPEAPEESMAVNLAMANFNRKVGIKSNVLSLYERMCYVDERISGSLDDQEFILRKIVNKLCEFVKHANGDIEFKVQFSNFITDPFHIELFNKLLNSTINLRKKLEAFRICCNRLITIEDERNAIVEQIYTLPADQRMNCNYLVSIQTEKMQLENELQQIIKDQRRDQERIKDLNVIEEKLSNLQFQLNSLMFRSDDGYHISKMLQEVTSEARMLLDLTKQQRRKFELKMARIKETNLSLERILRYLKLALDNKDPSSTEMLNNGITTVDDFKTFECIKKEVDCSRNKLKCRLFDELQSKQWETEMLKNKLSQVMFENNELKAANVRLKRNMSDMKFNQDLDLASLREERDMFKKQVEDLEAIREAYAHLVYKQPSVTKTEKQYLEQIKFKDDLIYDLEKTNRDLTKELKAMRNTVNKQNREIKQQARIIDDAKQHPRNVNESKEKNLECVYKNRNSEMYCSLRDMRELPEHHHQSSYVELYQQEIYVQEKIINWVDDGGNHPPQYTSIPMAFTSRRLDNNGDSVRKESDDLKERKVSVTADVTETNVTGNAETELQRSIKKDGAPAFCKSKSGECEKGDFDEYELMKDCSEESIPRVCHPRTKFKETYFQQRYSVINDHVEY